MGIKHKAVKASRDKGLASEWNDDHEIDGDVNFEQHEAQNMIIHTGTSFPAGPVEGQMFYRTDLHEMYYWNATGWVLDVPDDSITINKIEPGAICTHDYDTDDGPITCPSGSWTTLLTLTKTFSPDAVLLIKGRAYTDSGGAELRMRSRLDINGATSEYWENEQAVHIQGSFEIFAIVGMGIGSVTVKFQARPNTGSQDVGYIQLDIVAFNRSETP